MTNLERKLNFLDARTEFEKQFITRALIVHKGCLSVTAKAIGLARRNLQYKVHTLGIDIESIRKQFPDHEAVE